MALSKVLLIWLSPMPDEIVNRFTNVSSNLPELIQYVATNVITTNSFHLIIPSDYLEDLLKNPIYKFSQIQRIDVYCDDFDALFEIQHRFNLHGDERIQFHLIRDIPQYLNRITCDNILIQEGSINQHTINALVSSIEDRIIAKKSVISLRHSQILKKFPASNLNGFPVKNSGEIHVCFMCTSCNLMFPQLYRLSCGHRTCSTCVTILKGCTVCSRVITKSNQGFINNDGQMIMQTLEIVCSNCDWSGLLADYSKHFTENHQYLLTCLIDNLRCDNHSGLSSDDLSMQSMNGTCIFEISDIETMLKIENANKSVHSIPFYSFPNGYKMNIQFYPNGDTRARRTHMSLYVVILRGRNDENLQWPFQHKITVTLLNHVIPHENLSNSFRPVSTSIAFQRPTSNMNDPYGISTCFPLALFNKHRDHYVQNDKIYIKIQIDFSADIPVSALAPEIVE